MFIIINCLSVNKRRINHLNRGFCCKDVVGIHLSWCWSEHHVRVDMVFYFLNDSLIRNITQEAKRFVAPGNILVWLEVVGDILVLRLLNKTLHHLAWLSSNDEHIFIKTELVRNKCEIRTPLDLKFVVFHLRKNVSFNWISQGAHRIIPNQNFAVTWNCGQTHVFLETVNALRDHPLNLLNRLPVEVFICLGLRN